jgi:hypothetical protein
MIKRFSETCLCPCLDAHRQASGRLERSVPPPGSALQCNKQSYKQVTDFSIHIHIK